MFDWRCSSCGREFNEADEIGLGRCPQCGHELDDDDDKWTEAIPDKGIGGDKEGA